MHGRKERRPKDRAESPKGRHREREGGAEGARERERDVESRGQTHTEVETK